jgi:hypothetical protein
LFTQFLTGGAQRCLAGVEQIQLAAEGWFNPVRSDECPVRGRRRRESIRHPHTLIRERANHLTERRILSADLRDVFKADFVEPHQIALVHRSPAFWGLG